MSDTDDKIITDAIAEAKGSFDLKSRLQRRPMRTDSIRVYTDEVTGDALGDDRVDDIKQGAFTIGQKVVRYGVIGQIADLGDELEKADDSEKVDLESRIAALVILRDELREDLRRTSLILELQNVPDIAKAVAKRAAKKTCGIKGKITEDVIEDYNKAFTAHLLADAVVSIVDVESNSKNTEFGYTDAVDLKDLLPESEYARLDNFLADILFKGAVGESVTAGPDFSPSI